MSALARNVAVIGIGPGNPRQITVEAVDEIRAADAFIFLTKPGAPELNGIRQEILERYRPGADYRIVAISDPERPRGGLGGDDGYRLAVARWHADRAALVERALADDIAESERAAFLVWGDPALYDSTLRILDEVATRGEVVPDVRVVPGVTSASALTAAHKILANRIGQPILTTTGRRLARDGGSADSTVVMLDADCSFQTVASPIDEIYWGAYLGTEWETLIAGTVGEVGAQIVRTRAELRERHGWIMDIYLLRSAR